MKTRSVFAVAGLCALAGWTGAGMAIRGKEEPAAAPVSAAKESSTAASNLELMRAAGSVLSQWRATVERVDAEPDAVSLLERGMDTHPSAEADELAARLAMDRILRKHRDDPVRLKQLLARSGNYYLMRAWCYEDPAHAAWSIYCPGAPVSDTDFSYAGTLSRMEPALMLELLRKRKSSQYLLESALCSIGQSDPALAASALREIPARRRGDFACEIARMRAQKDPDEAMKWAGSLTGPERGKALAAAMAGKLAADPASAEAVLKAHPEIAKENAGEVFSLLAAADPKVTLKLLPDFNSKGADEVRMTCISSIARQDPQSALKWLEHPSLSRSSRSQLVWSVASSWSQQSQADAAKWALALTSTDERQAAAKAIRCNELPVETQRAVAEAAGLHTSEGFNLLRKIDPDEALRVFSGLHDNHKGSMSFHLLVRENPAEMARYTEHFPTESRSRIISETAAEWAAFDRTGALNWVNTLPPDDSRAKAMANVAVAWSQHDLQAACAWAENLPEALDRNVTLGELAKMSDVFGDKETARRFREMAGVKEAK